MLSLPPTPHSHPLKVKHSVGEYTQTWLQSRPRSWLTCSQCQLCPPKKLETNVNLELWLLLYFKRESKNAIIWRGWKNESQLIRGEGLSTDRWFTFLFYGWKALDIALCIAVAFSFFQVLKGQRQNPPDQSDASFGFFLMARFSPEGPSGICRWPAEHYYSFLIVRPRNK